MLTGTGGVHRSGSIMSTSHLSRIVPFLVVGVCLLSSMGEAAITRPSKTVKRPMMSAGRTLSELGSVGFDKQKTLSFIDYLSEDSMENIETFDKLSVGLNMTIENFFTFINKLLEDDVRDPTDEEDPEAFDEDTLTVSQLGQLFGGVNASAVDYILNTLDTTADALHAGFNTVDVIMVLMFVSSHLEAGGIPLSLLDIIEAFCDDDGFDMDADLWAGHIAEKHGVSTHKVEHFMSQLEGSLEDIMGYVMEIVKPDTCELIVNGTPLTAARMAPRMGNLRGASPNAFAAKLGNEPSQVMDQRM